MPGGGGGGRIFHRALAAAGPRGAVRRLHVVLGDQLDPAAPLLADGFDQERDAVLMMEAAQESRHVPSHRQRTAVFLAAMRHFALELAQKGVAVRYLRLDDPASPGDLDAGFRVALEELEPDSVRVMRPGEWRVLAMVDAWRNLVDGRLEMVEDPHFYLTPAEFGDWVRDRKELVLEHFYRMMRKRFRVLMEEGHRPAGDRWNYDADNRRPYRGGLDKLPERHGFRPDAVTREVLEMVAARFPEGPGELDGFAWPVTRAQARQALEHFITRALPRFGETQDAMRAGAPWMHHSLLSSALNLKLLDPRECVAAAEQAWRDGRAPLAAVEGFVRQVLGWREFIRGVYFHAGPGYGQDNHLEAFGALPELYWTGQTDMACLADSVGQVLRHGYGHHIQRLMVTGNFALVAGLDPEAVHAWYLGMYVDAVDWVTRPNTQGMVLYADGGLVATKPYAASGRYIQRMSDHCDGCPYDPGRRSGREACPFTVFYWDFLRRHRERFAGNRRMALALRNLERISAGERAAISRRASELRRELGIEPAGPSGAAGQ